MAIAHNMTASAARSDAPSFFAGLRARVVKYRTYRNTLTEMSELSDRELADLGLHRSMLKGLAYRAVYGK